MLKKYIHIPYNLWEGIYQTGSTVICDPPVTDTDEDYIICTTIFWELDKFLLENGFTKTSKYNDEYKIEGEEFYCYRKDHINLIVTESYEYYIKWTVATKLAKRFKLNDKKDRITLFKLILE